MPAIERDSLADALDGDPDAGEAQRTRRTRANATSVVPEALNR